MQQTGGLAPGEPSIDLTKAAKVRSSVQYCKTPQFDKKHSTRPRSSTECKVQERLNFTHGSSEKFNPRTSATKYELSSRSKVQLFKIQEHNRLQCSCMKWMVRWWIQCRKGYKVNVRDTIIQCQCGGYNVSVGGEPHQLPACNEATQKKTSI